MKPNSIAAAPSRAFSIAQRRMRRQTQKRIKRYSHASLEEVDRRLSQLKAEWSVDRVLLAGSAAVMLAAWLWGRRSSGRKQLLLPVVGATLVQQAIKGWSPPAAALMTVGFRTADEIDYERELLQRLRTNLLLDCSSEASFPASDPPAQTASAHA